jgi:hypothetical protein
VVMVITTHVLKTACPMTSSTLIGAAMNSMLNIVSEQRRLTHLANAN